MAKPLRTSLPINLELDGNYIIRVTAVDPTTGAVVPGVVVSGVAIQATNRGQPIDDLTPTPLLVPSSLLV